MQERKIYSFAEGLLSS